MLVDWGNGQSMKIILSQGLRCVHEHVSPGGHAHEGECAHLFYASRGRPRVCRGNAPQVQRHIAQTQWRSCLQTPCMGKDLLLFTADDLVADLRMTRFGARKALVLRDAFLRG